MRSVKYILENPKWWVVILIGLLCILVPIVGTIVFMGYLATSLMQHHKTKKDPLIDFDFNLLGDYLKTGIWPFLAMLIPGLIYGLLFGLFFFGTIGLSIATKKPEGIALFAPFLSLINFPIIILLHFILVPCVIGGALGQSLKAAFARDFIFDFIKKMWAETLISLLFLWAVSFAAAIAGLLLCCVGTYLSIPFMFMVQWHLYWQLYEEYLKKEGIAIVTPKK